MVGYFVKTDVVKLDKVRYISKNLSEKRSRHGKEVYCLTLSNPDTLFYEVYFSSERLVDDVIDYIENLIDDGRDTAEEIDRGSE